eukprot:GEMP01049917.1.p1 GENE.GEMP01049917.1~~GEMP01049917.1.p1  ORF type:complete len:287 (+),score=19.01 GEMP01049917.1:121-981(+)
MWLLDYEPVKVFYLGFLDALRLHRCVLLLLQSHLLRYRTIQCFVLNGVIFLGSLLLFNHVVSPLLQFVLSFATEKNEEDVLLDAYFTGLSILYHILWIYPIYCLSFILNTVMYQDLADEAFAISRKCVSDKPRRCVSALRRVVDEMFRVLLNFLYIVWMHVLYFIPVVGPVLYFVHFCWLASLYAFEYRWVSLKWNTAERLQYFEKHWIYFIGFGFPVSCLCFICPRFVDTGVFAILFPLFIFTSTMAQPKSAQNSWVLPNRIPIFTVAQTIACYVLRLAERHVPS